MQRTTENDVNNNTHTYFSLLCTFVQKRCDNGNDFYYSIFFRHSIASDFYFYAPFHVVWSQILQITVVYIHFGQHLLRNFFFKYV